ncbi:MAG: glutamine amidotransferase-related protein, partial [Microgenomates group bacterium]
ANLGELKSKPAQTSVHILNGMGIQPDIMVARSEKPFDQRRLERLALFCNVEPDHIFSSPDMDSVYKVPVLLANSNGGFDKVALKLLGLKPKKHRKLTEWKKFISLIDKQKKKTVKIAIAGKYFATGDYKLADSYVSVIESLKHAAWKLGAKIDLSWIDCQDLEKKNAGLDGFAGIIVPQGWGSRGVEGKIAAVKFARENKIPYLGLCFGMQMAVIEFGRHVLGLRQANSLEVDPQTPYPVIHIMPNQAEYLAKRQYGGTIRLGAWPCLVKRGTLLERAYRQFGNLPEAPWFQARDEKEKTGKAANLLVYERHRHRYEFNNEFRERYEAAGLIISGTSPDGKLVEAIELTDHPFFLGTQFHPEYISRPLTPHPIFVAFLEAILKL